MKDPACHKCRNKNVKELATGQATVVFCLVCSTLTPMCPQCGWLLYKMGNRFNLKCTHCEYKTDLLRREDA